MKCILNQIYTAQSTIEKILKMDMPVKEAFLWRKLVKAINEELGQFEGCRKGLVDKYAEKDAEGRFNLLEENKEAFNSEIQELLTVEMELNIKPLDLSKLGNIKVSAIDIMALEPFIVPQN